MKKNKKEIQAELEALAPSLSKMEKEEVFKVPENYFDNLPDQILKELALGEEPVLVEKHPRWWTQLMDNLMMLMQPRIAVGLASLALLLTSAFYLMDNNGGVIYSPHTELSSLEAENYVLENIDDFEDDLLYEIALESDLVENNNLEDQELDNYLDEIIDEMDDETLEEFL